MRGAVIVFAKAPRAGAVKTRLGAEIGMGRAAALFREMTARTLAEAGKGPWKTIVAVDPPSAMRGWESTWPPHLPRTPQASGNLGARMKRAFETAPPGPALIIGADAPGLRARHLRRAFDLLRAADAVFGPAEDGGYWLIGLARRRAAPDLFDQVRWSSADALADTLATLPAGHHVEMLEPLADIDVQEDLQHLRPRSFAR